MIYLKRFVGVFVLLLLFIAITFSCRDIKYFPQWAKLSKNNTPIWVLDTNSSLGRYSQQTKELNLQDMAKMHGHLCDGLVISYIELKYALEKLFPNKIIDRTDIRVITKNGPCWVDACMFITGARINFGTLSIDNSLVNSIIVQKISTGEAYQVSLKEGVFPEELSDLEKMIKEKRKLEQKVSDDEIKKLETLANDLSKKLLTTNLNELLNIKKLENYKFEQNIEIGQRSDIINKE